MGEDICNTYKCKGLASRIYKVCWQINKKKSDRWAKGWNNYFTKLLITMSYHQTLRRLAEMNKSDNSKDWGRCGGSGTSGLLMGVYVSGTSLKHGLASLSKLHVLSTQGQAHEGQERDCKQQQAVCNEHRAETTAIHPQFTKVETSQMSIYRRMDKWFVISSYSGEEWTSAISTATWMNLIGIVWVKEAVWFNLYKIHKQAKVNSVV